MGRCKFCPAVVKWAKTPSGKPICLEREECGNVVILEGVAVIFGSHERLKRDLWNTRGIQYDPEDPAVQLYVAHKARCEHFAESKAEPPAEVVEQLSLG
jgi:hypothetical protein